MKREYIFTVVFTFIISAMLTTILAGANAFFLPQIQRNEEIAQKRAILYVLNVPFAGDSDLDRIFEESVRTATISGVELFSKHDASATVEGYAIPFQGAGLWGQIKGYLGISADLTEVLGIEFTDQNETPGLGSRIDEDWYKEQFRGIQLMDGKAVLEDPSGAPKIDAITGATATSNAVLNILRNTTQTVLARLEVEK